MRKEWIDIIPQIANDFDNIHQIKCPNCGKNEMEYIYIGDKKTKIGYLQIWCNECLKGIYVSRIVAPPNARFVTYDDDLKNIVPKYEFIEG